MRCLKCGREGTEGQAFCPECLRVIEQQPITKDMTLVLPNRENSTSRRNSGKKRVLSTEEKLAQTRVQLQRSRILTVVLSALVVLLIGVCIFLMTKHKEPAVGQNYMTPSTTTTTVGLPVT